MRGKADTPSNMASESAATAATTFNAAVKRVATPARNRAAVANRVATIHTTAHASGLILSVLAGRPAASNAEQPEHPWLTKVGSRAAVIMTTARRLTWPALVATCRFRSSVFTGMPSGLGPRENRVPSSEHCGPDA
jgi:hypothetical protein